MQNVSAILVEFTEVMTLARAPQMVSVNFFLQLRIEQRSTACSVTLANPQKISDPVPSKENHE